MSFHFMPIKSEYLGMSDFKVHINCVIPCSPQTGSPGVTQNLLEMRNCRVHVYLPDQNLHFNKRWVICMHTEI